MRALASLQQDPTKRAESVLDLIAAVEIIANKSNSLKGNTLPESTIRLIQLIGSIDTPDTIGTLVNLLDSERMELALASAETLGAISCRESLPALKKLTRRPEFTTHYGFRFGVFRAIAQIRDPDGVEFLTGQLPHLTGQLAHEVEKFLGDVTLSHFRGDQKRFEAWKIAEHQRMQLATDDESASTRYGRYERPQYYGIDINAEKLIFVIDHSSSMAKTDAGTSRLERAQRELIRTIHALPKTTSFTIVLFHASVKIWKRDFVEASDRNKKIAIRYVQRIPYGKGTNTYGGLERALGLSDETEAVFLLSDGEPTRGRVTSPAQIIRVVSHKNAFRHIMVNTIGISTTATTARFMRELAAQNSGEYSSIP